MGAGLLWTFWAQYAQGKQHRHSWAQEEGGSARQQLWSWISCEVFKARMIFILSSFFVHPAKVCLSVGLKICLQGKEYCSFYAQTSFLPWEDSNFDDFCAFNEACKRLHVIFFFFFPLPCWCLAEVLHSWNLWSRHNTKEPYSSLAIFPA